MNMFDRNDTSRSSPGLACLALLASMVAGASFCQAQQAPAAAHKPAQKPPAAPAKPAAAPFVLPEPSLPVLHARQNGLGQCESVLADMSRQTLAAPYNAQSIASDQNPADHIFQSLASTHNAGQTPADGATAMVVAPMRQGACDGVAMQVFPLAGSCEIARQLLIKQGGRPFAVLANMTVMLNANHQRVALLPGYANTCIGITVESYYGAP